MTIFTRLWKREVIPLPELCAHSSLAIRGNYLIAIAQTDAAALAWHFRAEQANLAEKARAMGLEALISHDNRLIWTSDRTLRR